MAKRYTLWNAPHRAPFKALVDRVAAFHDERNWVRIYEGKTLHRHGALVVTLQDWFALSSSRVRTTVHLLRFARQVGMHIPMALRDAADEDIHLYVDRHLLDHLELFGGYQPASSFFSNRVSRWSQTDCRLRLGVDGGWTGMMLCCAPGMR